MALHPTLSDVHFKKSMTQFLITELVTGAGLNLFFDEISEVPRNDSDVELNDWIIVSFEEKNLDTLASSIIMLDIFTRQDEEGYKNSEILDLITDVFMDESSTNGLNSIPFYDTTVDGSWVLIGGILPTNQQIGSLATLKDLTKLRSIAYDLRWGA